MKKISKLAALLTASALLLAGTGFVSCSSDDDDKEEDVTPKLTVAADSAISVKAGEGIDVTLTATLKNDTFAGDIPSGADLSAYVTVTPSNAAYFENDLAVRAAEDIAAGGTTAKVNVSVTTTAEAVSGTIIVTIAGEALKSGKDLTSNALSYTIASTSGGGSDPVAQGIALPYTADFTALTGGTAVSADTYVAGHAETGTPSVDLSGFPTATVPLEVNGASAKNGLRLRTGTNYINYNGGTKEAFATTTVGATLSETLDRDVALDVSKLDASGNVTVTFTGIAKTSEKGTACLGQVVLIDQNKTILASATNLKIDATGTAEGVDSFTLTATIDPTSVTKVTLGFSRGGVGGGGIDLTGITAIAASAE